MCIRDRSGIGFIHKEAGGVFGADINGLRPFLEGLGTVSYTHLDVYKRQFLYCPHKMGQFKTGIDRGSWFVFRAFKQVPKSTLILALLLELCGEYNHTGRSFLVALRLAITGFFDP